MYPKRVQMTWYFPPNKPQDLVPYTQTKPINKADPEESRNPTILRANILPIMMLSIWRYAGEELTFVMTVIYTEGVCFAQVQ